MQDATHGWVLRKTTNNDPDGGWAPLGGTLGDFELVLFARKVNTDGGNLVRYSLTDGDGNGYGVYLDYGKPVLCFTVNEPERAAELFGWGVKSVFSDAPDLINPPD